MTNSYSQLTGAERFKEIFLDHWDGFKNKHFLYNTNQYKAVVEKMLGCGKEGGGYSEYRCLGCGSNLRRVAFTCKSSFCLSCAKVYVDDFVAQVSKVLHPGVTYRHIVLTIPKQLRIYFYKDRFEKTLLSSLMRTGYECLEAVVSEIKRQALKTGTIVVVQTHGRSGKYNPHLHIIMTSGGMNESNGEWVDLKYFPYEKLHKSWEYYLFRMMKSEIDTKEMKPLINKLWKKYPNGLVANVSKGDVPEKCKGLAQYLGKYLASPPISVRRIVKYDGKTVTYWYNDHETKKQKEETVRVYTFIGRMVQHILPKGFQRIRYYGLQSTKTFSKWCNVITEGLKLIGKIAKGVYQVVSGKKYRERYKGINGKDPLLCSRCGSELELYRVWHPKYGEIYNALKNIKSGKYESKDSGGGRCSIRPPPGVLQLPLYQM